jgi:hypothetical protein
MLSEQNGKHDNSSCISFSKRMSMPQCCDYSYKAEYNVIVITTDPFELTDFLHSGIYRIAIDEGVVCCFDIIHKSLNTVSSIEVGFTGKTPEPEATKRLNNMILTIDVLTVTSPAYVTGTSELEDLIRNSLGEGEVNTVDNSRCSIPAIACGSATPTASGKDELELSIRSGSRNLLVEDNVKVIIVAIDSVNANNLQGLGSSGTDGHHCHHADQHSECEERRKNLLHFRSPLKNRLGLYRE